MATWENLTAIHQAFPCAPAWGQAGSQDRGNVNTGTTTTVNPEDKDGNGPKRSARNRRPNKNLIGDNWK